MPIKYDPRTRLTGSMAGAMVAMVGRRRIKSVQRGLLTPSGTWTSSTLTITSVDVANSLVMLSGGIGGGTASGAGTWAAGTWGPSDCRVGVTLTNATTVTATRSGNVDVGTWSIAVEVIEFYPGVIRSVTYGTIAYSSTSSTGTVALSDITRAHLMYMGEYGAYNTTYAPQNSWQKLVVTNTTTLTASVNTGAGAATLTFPYCVVEWWP